MIADRGHEIASHGYSHALLTDMDRQQFTDELLQTGQTLFEQTGRRPVGYRAPQWSVSPRTPWVDEILAEHGYRYDSSRNPLPDNQQPPTASQPTTPPATNQQSQPQGGVIPPLPDNQQPPNAGTQQKPPTQR